MPLHKEVFDRFEAGNVAPSVLLRDAIAAAFERVILICIRLMNAGTAFVQFVLRHGGHRYGWVVVTASCRLPTTSTSPGKAMERAP